MIINLCRYLSSLGGPRPPLSYQVKAVSNVVEEVLESSPSRPNSTVGLLSSSNHDLADQALDSGSREHVVPLVATTQNRRAHELENFELESDRKSIFERSLVGTRIWLPVPRVPAPRKKCQPYDLRAHAHSGTHLREKSMELQSAGRQNPSRSPSMYDRPQSCGNSAMGDKTDISSVDEGKLERVVRLIKRMREVEELRTSPISSPTSSAEHMSLDDASPQRSSTSSAVAPLSRPPSVPPTLTRTPGSSRGSHSYSRDRVDPFLQTVVLSEQLDRSSSSTLSPTESPLWSSTIKEDLLEAVDRICAECDATTSHLTSAFRIDESTVGQDEGARGEEEKSPPVRARPFKELERLLSSNSLSLDKEMISKLKLMTLCGSNQSETHA